ncbi:MarC family protein [Candidatus Pyrohabitans sp.]
MDINFLIYAFTALFVIIDPIANVPVFLALLSGASKEEYRRAVARAALIAAAVLLLFTYLGVYIFSYLGIEMYSFRIAGGLLLFIIAMEMLFGMRTRTELTPEEEAERREEVVVTPLAVPLLTGPGAITTGIVLLSRAPGEAERLLLALAIVLVFLASYLILRNADTVYRLLGTTGTKVVTRLMGLLLAAIAVQFVIDGIAEAFAAIA